jgi:hypothetical protein
LPRESNSDRRLDASKPCPCESGKNYGSCCWKKKFQWRVNKRGEISKVIPLVPEALEILKRQMAEFKAVFGRKPLGDEPIFVSRYFLSKEDMDDQFNRAAKVANVRPEILYATEKTDRIVTKETWELLTGAEQKEWNDAIDEYFKMKESGRPDDGAMPANVTLAFADLMKDLYATICHVGSFVERGPRKKYDEKTFLQYYFATRTLDTMRTAYRWLSERYSDDILMLIRIIYESYLRLVFLRSSAGAPKFFYALAGIENGTYDFKKSAKGRRDYRFVIDAYTGEAIKNVSNREMISSSGDPLDVELYDELYAFLSSHSHMGLDADMRYFDLKGGFLIHKNDNPFIALQWISIVVSLWLDELAKITHVKKQTARDLGYMANRVRDHVIALFALSRISDQSHLLKLVHKRLKSLRTAPV